MFIPRPETESLLEWALAQPLSQRPLIVDLCTGSGALALALAAQWPGARVIAVDDSDDALAYARRNVRGTAVELLRADVTAPGLLTETRRYRRSGGGQPALHPRRCRAGTRSGAL